MAIKFAPKDPAKEAAAAKAAAAAASFGKQAAAPVEFSEDGEPVPENGKDLFGSKGGAGKRKKK